ncbi:hypothetical protein NMG60_11020205 [Bertholletia excelsa]
MENPTELLINELTQGRELAKQLHMNLKVSNSSSEARRFLLHQILNSYENALSMLNLNGGTGDPNPAGAAGGFAESPRSLGSPLSEDSDKELRDHEPQDPSKKRKNMVQWTKQVKVSPGEGIERSLDDGYNWRKYGQKEILRAKYPRGYYRCTHRNSQGCLATKQVQKSDSDPTVFEIRYRGTHTCTNALYLSPSSPAPPELNHEPNTPQIQLQNPPEMLLSFQTGLRIMAEGLEDTGDQSAQSFYFPTTPTPTDTANFSPSGSNYFPVSSTQASTGFGGNPNHNFQGSVLDPNGIVPAATSATNSPPFGLGCPFGSQFDQPDFSFDDPGFFR